MATKNESCYCVETVRYLTGEESCEAVVVGKVTALFLGEPGVPNTPRPAGKSELVKPVRPAVPLMLVDRLGAPLKPADPGKPDPLKPGVPLKPVALVSPSAEPKPGVPAKPPRPLKSS